MTTIADYLSLVFWSTLLHLNRSFVRFVTGISPAKVIKNRVIAIFASVGVKIVCEGDDDSDVDVGKDKQFKSKIVVKDDRFFVRVVREATVGLGEAYMDGWFECDDIPNLFRLLALGLKPKTGRKLLNKVALARNRQGIVESQTLIDVHYNLGNDLFESMLDKRMSYTCGLWYPDTKSLEEAQNNKHDLIGRKLKLKPGMKVLDIGGGFGAAAKYLAENFGVSVDVYNISTEQVKYGREMCKNVDVTFIMNDYRTASGQYDAIYSIGFFEAVGTKNFRGYFELIDRCLKPEGLALTHTIISADHVQQTDGWINKYIFPNGELPYMRDLLTSASPLLVTEDIQSFAKSYAKTLHEWNARFQANYNNIKDNYDHQQDGKFHRMWSFYLGICEGSFLARTSQLTQIVHSKFTREEEYYSVRDQRI